MTSKLFCFIPQWMGMGDVTSSTKRTLLPNLQLDFPTVHAINLTIEYR